MASVLTKFSTNRILKALVAIVVLVIGAVLFISIRQSQRVRDTADMVAQTETILYHLQKLELSVVDNETGARGYVITGKPEFSSIPDEAAKNIRTELAILKKLIGDSSIRHLLYDSLNMYIEKRIDFSKQMISVHQQKGADAAAALVATGIGKSYTDEVRRIGTKLQQRENELLYQRRKNNERTISRLSTTLYWVLGISFLLSIGIILRVRSDVWYIDQRRKKEEELRKSEERFRLLISNVKDYAIFMIDPNGAVESWNSGAESIKGYKAEEIIGKHIEVFYTNEDREKDEPRFILEMARQHGHFEKEGWRVRKDGSLFWANMVINAMVDEKGKLLGYSKITRDMTERKKQEEQLEFLSRQLNQSNDAIYVINPARKIKSWNKGAENLYGFTKEEALNKDANTLLQTFITDEQIDAALQELADHDYWAGELKRKTKAGKEIYIRASSTTIRDERGMITGLVSVNLDITEQKELEQKLKQFNQELEEQVRQKTTELTGIFERVTDGFIAIDKEFRYLYINKMAGKMIHRDPSAMIGKKLVDEYPYIVDTKLYAGFIEAMASQQSVVITEYYEALDLTLENYIYPSPEGLSIFIRDITEKKRTERELRTAHNRLLFHVENAPLGFVEWDSQLQVRSWSKRAEEIFGWTEKELIEKDRNVPEENIVQLTAAIRQLISGAAERNVVEQQSYTKDGRIIWCEWFNSVIKDETGKVVTILSLVQDITERKKTEEDLVLSEQKYKLLFDNNPMPMWIRSLDDTYIIDVNKAACQAYGYSHREFMQLHAEDLRHPDEMESFLKEFGKEMPHAMNRGVWKHRKKDRNFVDVEIFAQDIIYNDQKARLILAKDVTERLKAEDQLRDSYQEIRRLVSYLQNIREEERTSMAREIHDQLGQQLTVMKMDISWLYKKMIDVEKPVRDRVEELKEIMDDTVKLVRRISSDLRPNLLDDMGLLAALEWQLSEIEKRSGFAIELTGLNEEPALPKVSKTNIFRIIQESLTNVSRYAQAKKVMVNLSKQEDQLVLTIADDGIGFDSEKIAEKRTLGLLGMRERTAMMGGVYKITSSPGQGTRVLVSIPLIPDHNTAESSRRDEFSQ